MTRELVFYGRNCGSGLVRGEQIARPLGAPFNPDTHSADALCVHVGRKVQEAPGRHVVDLVGCHRLVRWVAGTSHEVICFSDHSAEYVRSMISNRIHVIPQHHCNEARFLREERPVKVVGFIGAYFSFQYPIPEMTARCADLGLKFVAALESKAPRRPTQYAGERERVVDFYRGIDIQVAFRFYAEHDHNDKLKDAFKVMNAGSFGIPTVSAPEFGYEADARGAYVPARTADEMIAACGRLAGDHTYYQDIAGKARELSERHHISHILPLYEALRDDEC